MTATLELEARPAFMEIDRPDLAGKYFNEQAKCWVYEIWDSLGRLAYVGIADNWETRWAQHKRKSWWLDEIEVDRIYLNGYRTRTEAEETEAETIATQSPVYNTRAEKSAYARAQRKDLTAADDYRVPVGKRFFGIVWATEGAVG